MILIIGWGADPHIKSVIQALEHSECHFTLLDSYGKCSHGLHHQVSSAAILDLGGNKTRLADVSAVWFRQKPKYAIPNESTTALYDYFFVHREWNHIIDYIGVEAVHLFSINNRDKAAIANNKMTQLKFAADAGFQVPPTLISNHFESIVDFVSNAGDKKCIYKTMSPYMPPTGGVTFTTLVDVPKLLENRDQLGVAPGIFQVFVKKQCELRIVVVGGDFFAARINSNHSSTTEIDWRQDQFSDIYSIYEMENDFLDKLLALHRKFGLFFAVYDFIINESGDFIFLEVNPSGQWMYVEYKLGFPIAERIASALANPPLAW